MKDYKNRLQLCKNLSDLNIETACEVGVQEGNYSNCILTQIPSLKKLYLVDLWEQQKNYFDHSNCNQEKHNEYFETTKLNVENWKHKVEFLRGRSTEMCHKIEDNTLDWVYIDARHDYCGCKEDIEAFWPKLKNGGIMSGHDYHTAEEIRRITRNKQDWSICEDGTKHDGAVRGAVDEFAKENNLQVVVQTSKRNFPTWSIEKK